MHRGGESNLWVRPDPFASHMLQLSPSPLPVNPEGAAEGQDPEHDHGAQQSPPPAPGGDSGSGSEAALSADHVGIRVTERQEQGSELRAAGQPVFPAGQSAPSELPPRQLHRLARTIHAADGSAVDPMESDLFRGSAASIEPLPPPLAPLVVPGSARASQGGLDPIRSVAARRGIPVLERSSSLASEATSPMVNVLYVGIPDSRASAGSSVIDLHARASDIPTRASDGPTRASDAPGRAQKLNEADFPRPTDMIVARVGANDCDFRCSRRRPGCSSLPGSSWRILKRSP